MFFTHDDYLLLMDIPNIDGRLLDDNELSMLSEAGIHATMMFLNPVGTQEFDPEPIERYITHARRYGMKVVIPACTAGPNWGPEDWYVRTETGGTQWGVLSPWSLAARDWLLGYYSRMLTWFAAPDVAIVDTQLTHGETLLLNEAAWFDASAIASYEDRYNPGSRPYKNVEPTENWLRDTYLGMMASHAAVLAEQPAKLLYTALHPAIADFGLYGNGCKWYPELLRMYRAKYPEHEITWVLYTFAQWPYLYDRIRALRTELNLRVFGGAEYAEGLPITTPAAIAAGIDGQFIGPLHPFTCHKQIEPQMIVNIRQAIEQWRAK